LAALIVVLAVGVGVITELIVGSIRGFWVAHPLTANLAGFSLTFATTVLLIDEVLHRRAYPDWEFVAHGAIRALSAEALLVCACGSRCLASMVKSIASSRQPRRSELRDAGPVATKCNFFHSALRTP
jgi:hypothetical protein